jgi:hypothetical protein
MYNKDVIEDIASMRKTLKHVEDFNKKYHPENPPYDLTDIIENSLHNCDDMTYRATAEYVTVMIDVFHLRDKEVRKVMNQCRSSLKRAIERSNELHTMAVNGGATPQNQGQFIALLESTIRDIDVVIGVEK